MFGEMRKVRASSTESKVDSFGYSCNLCGNEFKFVCEFDLHMRSHTKWGKRIAIIAIGTPFDQALDNGRVTEKNFLVLEKELMKAEGISAVIAIFKKKRLENFVMKDNVSLPRSRLD